MQNFNPQYGAMPNNGGYAYSVARPQPANSQPLTQQMADTLKHDRAELDMKVDQRDLWRAICTHKDPTTGQNTLAQNPDGSWTCSICGETFKFFDGTKEDVENAVNTLIDMFQTAKTIYMDAPVKMTEQYYQQIALLRKFPLLWDHAVKNFSKYENVDNPLNPISNNYGGFNALSTLLTNPYLAAQQMYGQPMYNQQMMYQQPQMAGYGQPMYNQQMMYQQPPQAGYSQPVMMNPDANPMAYGVPSAPVAPAPGVVPAAAPVAPAAAPAAPAAQNNEVQQQKVYNV